MPDIRPVDVVLFDLDDTLFAHRAAVTAGITAYRRALGGDIAAADDAGEAARWDALEEHHYHRYLAGELDFAGQRRARALGYLERFEIRMPDADADRWFDDYFEHYIAAWRLHDDALPVIDALTASGVAVGVITNGDRAFQTRKLEAMQLDTRVAHMVCSGDLGFAKPDPRIFWIACGVFDTTPDRALYVGDRLRTDAIGAAEAGLTGVWLDRAGTASPADLAAAEAAGAHVIRSLDALLPLATGR